MIQEAVADTVGRAGTQFVGDPFDLVAGGMIFAAVFGFGIFASVWILSRSGGTNQTTLTKLGAVAFGIGLSLLTWQTFAVSFLGLAGGIFETPNDLMKWLVGAGSLGATVPKIQSTIVQREQAKAGGIVPDPTND